MFYFTGEEGRHKRAFLVFS